MSILTLNVTNFTGNAMDVHDDVSLQPDESSFLPPVDFAPANANGNNPDQISIANILSSSERIHIADESVAPPASNFSPLENSQVK